MKQEYRVTVDQGRMSSMVPGLLSGHRTGHVHSLFGSSMNLQFGDDLVHIGTEEYGLCCFGITVSEQEMKLLLHACERENLVTWKQNRLTFYGRTHMVVLELDNYKAVDLRIPVISRMLPDNREETAVDRRIEIESTSLYQKLKQRSEIMELGLERNEEFERYSRILAGTDNQKETEEAAAFFYGRGKGLTPAGDDILVGYGAVLTAFGQAEELNAILNKLERKTTAVSEAYLFSMQKGYANELFCDIILQLKENEVLKLEQLLCRMERIGKTSGCDTLYGMYLGFVKMKEEYRV